MRKRIAETIFGFLFLGGLLGLNVVPEWVAARIGDEQLGVNWLAWLMAPLWLVLGWLAVPWLVQLSGRRRSGRRGDAKAARTSERTDYALWANVPDNYVAHSARTRR